MKRAVIGLTGLLYGALLAWTCLYVISRLGWSLSNKASGRCYEIDKCAVPWWVLPSLIFYIVGPAVLFTVLNAVAWKRWSLTKWGSVFSIATVGIVGLYFLPYVLR